MYSTQRHFSTPTTSQLTPSWLFDGNRAATKCVCVSSLFVISRTILKVPLMCLSLLAPQRVDRGFSMPQLPLHLGSFVWQTASHWAASFGHQLQHRRLCQKTRWQTGSGCSQTSSHLPPSSVCVFGSCWPAFHCPSSKSFLTSRDARSPPTFAALFPPPHNAFASQLSQLSKVKQCLSSCFPFKQRDLCPLFQRLRRFPVVKNPLCFVCQPRLRHQCPWAEKAQAERGEWSLAFEVVSVSLPFRENCWWALASLLWLARRPRPRGQTAPIALGGTLSDRLDSPQPRRTDFLQGRPGSRSFRLRSLPFQRDDLLLDNAGCGLLPSILRTSSTRHFLNLRSHAAFRSGWR